MVRIREKTIDGRTYYYLEHSRRIDGNVQKKEWYIGKTLPSDLEEIKIEFTLDIYEDKWYVTLERIKSNYLRAHRAMPKSAIEKASEEFMIRFTYNTQRIEGSTLTLRETAILLEEEITPSLRPLSDVKEAESHKKLFREMLLFEGDLSLHVVLNWHNSLFYSTKPDIAGKIRTHQVAISGSTCKPPMPLELNPLLMDLFRWYNRNKTLIHPVELAASAHLKFVSIHPFSDGNGRLGRLILNFILNRNRYPMLDIPYRNRHSYYNALERSQKRAEESIFIQWLFRNYIKENKKYLEMHKY